MHGESDNCALTMTFCLVNKNFLHELGQQLEFGLALLQLLGVSLGQDFEFAAHSFICNVEFAAHSFICKLILVQPIHSILDSLLDVFQSPPSNFSFDFSSLRVLRMVKQ